MKTIYPDTKPTKENNASIDIPSSNDKYMELCDELQAGINDITLGNTRPFAEAMADVKVKRSK